MRLLLVVSLLLPGCALFTAQNVTTFTGSIKSDGTVTISSGKDVKVENATFSDAKSGVSFSLKGYSSMANTAAIDAETNREIAQAQAIVNAINAGAALAGKVGAAAVKP